MHDVEKKRTVLTAQSDYKSILANCVHVRNTHACMHVIDSYYMLHIQTSDFHNHFTFYGHALVMIPSL